MNEIKLRWLVVGAILSSIGMSFIWPLTTIYMHNRLGASLTTVGIVLLFYSLANVVGSTIGGRLFDRFNPYWLTIGGVSLTLLTLALMIPFHGWPAFPVGLIFIGFGSGWNVTMINSLGTTIRSLDGRHTFNMLYFAQNLGVVLGTALVGFVYGISITLLFVITTVLYALMLTVVALNYRPAAIAHRTARERTALTATVPQPNVWIMMTFFVTLVVIWVMYEQWISNLAVYMTGMGIAMRDYSLLWTINAGLIVIFQTILNWLGNVIKSLMAQFYLGVFFVAISFALLIIAKDYAHFVLAMVILTLGEATAFPAIPAMVNRLTPDEVKGKYQGMANAWASVGRAIGPLFGGLIIDHFSYTSLFIVATVAIFCMILVDWFVFRRLNHLATYF